MNEMKVGKKYNIKHKKYGNLLITVKIQRKGENHEGYKFYQVLVIEPRVGIDNWLYFEDIIEANLI